MRSDYHIKVKYIFEIYIWSAVKNIFVRENLTFIEKISMLKYIFGFFYHSLNAPLAREVHVLVGEVSKNEFLVRMTAQDASILMCKGSGIT